MSAPANPAGATPSDQQEQQKRKNTELRMAASIADEVQRLNEELEELIVRENKLKEDPQQKAGFEAKAKEIESEIEALKLIHTHRSRSYSQRAKNAICAFIGRDDPIGPCEFNSMRGKNVNDQFRIGDQDESRILHRDDNGGIIAFSLLDVPKGPEKSLQVMRSHPEDWDEVAKIDPNKPLRFTTNNSTVKHYLTVYLAAKHDRTLEVNSSRSDRLQYWLRNTSVGLITRRKILKKEESRKIRAACSAYQDLLEEIEKTKDLTDQQKTAFKAELRQVLNNAFNAGLSDQVDPKNWVLQGLNSERLNQYQLEQMQMFKGQLQDPRIAKVFADCFKLMRQPQPQPVSLSSGPAAAATRSPTPALSHP